MNNGYTSYNFHSDNTSPNGPPCEYFFDLEGCTESFNANFIEAHNVSDSNITLTFSPSQSPYYFLLRNCGGTSGWGEIKAYEYDCSTCVFSRSPNPSSWCTESQTNTLQIKSGFVTQRLDVGNANCWCVPFALTQPEEYCDYVLSGVREISYRGESAYTFNLICQENEIGKNLQVLTTATIMSETQPSGNEFLINGIPPSEISQHLVYYYECNGYYFWRGTLKWDIPINLRCGQNLTIGVTPSATSGYVDAILESVKVIYEPYIGCEPSLSISPSKVRPDMTGGNAQSVLNVTLSEPAPPEGCQVNLIVEPVAYSGGHQHHDSSRPKGTITPNYIFFSEGETISSATYKSSAVAGIEKIKAEVDGEIKDEATIEVMVPGFYELAAGDGYVLTGWRSVHPENHFGTENTLFSLLDLADSFYRKRNNSLRINDISLIWGGLFDEDSVPPPWIPWKPPHKSHRTGKNVDIDDETAEGGIVNRSLLKKILKELDCNATVLHHGSHFHVTFP